MTSHSRVSTLAVWAGGMLPAGSDEWAGAWLVAAGAAALVALAAVAALVQSKRPVAGLTLLLVMGVLAPFEFPFGGGVVSLCLPLAAFVCGSFLLRLFRRPGRLALDRSRVVAATLAFLAVALLSFVIGQYPWFPAAHAPMSAQLVGLGLFLVSGGLLLAVGHQVATSAQLERLTWVFVGTGAFAVVTSVVSTFDVTAGPVAISDASSIGSGFWTWLVAISLAQALFNRDLTPPVRLAVGGVAAAALARGLLFAFSWVSGWLPPLVAVAVLLLVRLPRVTVASGLLALTPALLYAGPVLKTWMTGEVFSAMTRLEALRVMWRVIQHNPWLGFGPANYYHYTPLFPILGWWVRFNSHNNYVDLVGQTGLIGLLLFGWVAVEVLRLAVKLNHRVGLGFERAYVLGAIAGLAGSLVSGLLADWVIPFTYNIGVRGFRSSLLFWFFLGGLLALKRTGSQPAAVPAMAARLR